VRVGLIVDGISEYASLGLMLPRITAQGGDSFLRVARADIQPKAPYPVIARSCREAVTQLSSRGADHIVVLFDKEDRPECPADIAKGVNVALTHLVECRLTVVVKDTCYENWLVADLEALRAHPRRYSVKPRHRRAVQPNHADDVDALSVIRSIVQGDYDKVEDSKAIMAHVQPERLGAHSRSFRKLLRVAQHPKYLTQSRAP
jgi:hypothetical protein